MSIMARIKNLVTGFFSIFVGNLEKQSPEIAYENSINAMVGKYGDLKKATASIIRRREELADRLRRAELTLSQTIADLDAALESEGADDIGIMLIQKRETLTAEIEDVKSDLEQSEKDSEDAKVSLLAIKQEIERLKSEKDRMLSKLHNADARLAIQNQIEGLSVDADVQSLQNVRDHIKNRVAEAELGKELQANDFDARLAKLRQETGPAVARAKLEELKKKKAAEKAEAQKVTQELQQLVQHSVGRK